MQTANIILGPHIRPSRLSEPCNGAPINLLTLVNSDELRVDTGRFKCDDVEITMAMEYVILVRVTEDI
jgi:hypothetical protein